MSDLSINWNLFLSWTVKSWLFHLTSLHWVEARFHLVRDGFWNHLGE